MPRPLNKLLGNRIAITAVATKLPDYFNEKAHRAVGDPHNKPRPRRRDGAGAVFA
jgi:hypothetical protein